MIEDACRNDIRFMCLLAGKRAPDHSRISRFIQKHLQREVAEDLFYQLVILPEELGEIRFENLFVEGTKIEANANRYSFVLAKSTSKYKARVNENLAMLLERLTVEYGIGRSNVQEYREALKERQTERNIVFVHGRGKRKTQLQRDFRDNSDDGRASIRNNR